MWGTLSNWFFLFCQKEMEMEGPVHGERLPEKKLKTNKLS